MTAEVAWSLLKLLFENFERKIAGNTSRKTEKSSEKWIIRIGEMSLIPQDVVIALRNSINATDPLFGVCSGS